MSTKRTDTFIELISYFSVQTLCARDVAILLDDSGRLQEHILPPEKWQYVKHFVSSLISNSDPTNTDTRIALVKFGTVPEVIHWFSDTQNTQYIQTQLERSPYTGGEARQLITALNMVKNKVFNPLDPTDFHPVCGISP